MSTLSKSIGFHTAPFELKFNKELDYEKLKEQTQILDIIAQMGNLHICILDFYKHSFFYVSDPFFLCENDMKESLNIGEAIVERIIYHDDKEGQREMKDAACVFFGKYDRETQKNIILYSSHRLMYQDGKEFMITNKFKPFMFDDNNNVWMAIGTTSFATKNQKIEYAKVDPLKQYKLLEACNLVKEISFTKFDASVDVAMRLGVDPRKANQMVRGVVSLPHGTGKTVRVLVLCTPDKETEAKEAGADHVGLDDYIEKIKNGWTDVDVIICTPSVMAKIGAIGRILGPRGLMPNPKTGTVTMDIAQAVKEVKAGKIDFKVDKQGIIHASVGKVSFDPHHLAENALEFINTVIKLKPQALKGTYVKSIFISSTMSPGINIDSKSFSAAE